MGGTSLPRLVIVTRKTRLDELLARHGTMGQISFYLKSRGQGMEALVAAHQRFEQALTTVMQALPVEARQARVDRDELDRFLFAPDDIVVIIGQDGLVPNTAKYLLGQLTFGINPDAAIYTGVLCPHSAEAFPELLAWLEHRGSEFRVEQRVMARASREDGQTMLALNEVFIGHQSHQSARYLLRVAGQEERQSSSGLLCSTGTGATGWMRSIVEQLHITAPMPNLGEPRLSWYVREPWPSATTGASLQFGFIQPPAELQVVSEMGLGGVVFADGIEADRLEFLEGQIVTVTTAEHTLNLVMPAQPVPAVQERTDTKA